MIFFRFTLLLVVVVLAGCSTAAKSSYTANTAELLFGNNVQRYLEGRRKVLNDLNAKITSLDDQLLERLGSLHSLEKKLSDTRNTVNASNRDVNDLKRQLSEKRREAEIAYAQTNQLKEEADRLKEQERLARENQAKDKAEIDDLNKAITELEGEVIVMNRAIDRNLNLKAEQLLRQ